MYSFNFNNKKHLLVSLILLIIGTFFLYFNTFSGHLLNWDDTTYLLNNRLFSQNFNLKSLQNIYQSDHHISLVLMSFFAQIKWLGFNPYEFHLVNIFIHILNVLLVFFLSKTLLKNNVWALIIALLFAIHPMRSETVGWIFQRKDLFFTFFFLLSSLSFISFLKTKNILLLALVFIFGYLSSLSKIQAITLPLIIIALEFYIRKTVSVKSLTTAMILFVFQIDVLMSFNQIVLLLLIPSLISIYYKQLSHQFILTSEILKRKFKNKIIQKHASQINIANLIILSYIVFFVFFKLINNLDSDYLKNVIFSIIPLVVFYIFIAHQHITYKWKNHLLILIAMVILSGIVLFLIVKVDTSMTKNSTYPLIKRIEFGIYSFNYYILKFFFPFNLSAMHPYPDNAQKPLSLLFQISPYLFITISSVVGYFIAKMKNKALRNNLIFGIVFFVINISLVLHIIPIEGRVIVADRYTYLAYFGLFFAIVPLIFSIYNKWRNNKFASYFIKSFAILIFIIFSFQTFSRNKVWQNDEVFWTDVIKKDKSNHYANYSLALFYYEQQDYERAIGFYDKAIQKFDNDFEYYTNRGACYVKLKETTKAIDDFARAIDLNPKNAYAYNNRGSLFLQIGDIRNAFIDFQIATQIDSNYADAKANFEKTKMLQTAISSTSSSIDYSPEKSQLFNDIGVKKAMNGDIENALPDFNKAVLLDSLNVNAYKNRGNAYASLKKFDEAMFDYNKVLKFNPNDAGIFMNIGNIKHQQNDKSACEYWQKAKKLGLKDAQQMLNKFCK
ncbi:MAG: tetratricopeptide repeat protein [Bacteroidota bacterium]